jgi:hypothetical protein
MARYNSSLASNSISGATTLGSPYSGAFTNLTGTAPYTVTLPNPSLFPGSNQTFYNVTAGTITLSASSGSFNGTGGSAASTLAVYAGNVVSVTSDGTNYIVISEDGSALVATSGTFSGVLTVQASGGVSIAPSSAGTMDNVAIGGTAKSSGGFTSLTATGSTTLTANTTSSSTTTGTLIVTGGIGVSGSLYSGGTISATSLTATNVTGTLQTAAQPNITSTGSLTAPGLNVDSGTLYVDTTNDRVGVGTTGPQTVLELATTASINSSNYGQIKHLTLSRSEATRYNAYAGFGDQFGANTFGWRFGTVNNNIDYPTLYMVNGSVGIGTASSPVTSLQINATTSMASSGSVADLLSLTDNDGVTSGVSGARIGLTISAQSNIADRRIGIYATSNAPNFNTPDITFWASAQGVAYREITRISASNGNLGLGSGANPSAKLHVVASTPTSVSGAPSGTNILVDSSSNNFVTVRSTADNATNSGILMQDNNIGGYLIFRNYDSGNAAISDRMFLSGYQGVNISYGTSDGTDVTARTTVAKFDSNGLTVASTRFAAGSEYETASVSTGATISSTGYKELFRLSSSRLGCSGFFTICATRGNYVTTSQYAFSGSHNYQGTITQLSSSNYTQVNVNLDVNSGGEVIISIDWGLGYTASFPMDYSVTVIKMQGGGAINFGNQGADRSATPDGYQRRFNFTSQANGIRAENAYFSSLAKASGSFKIDHPLPELEETTNLTHSFIEGPKADLIYRGVVDLVAGQAEVNIDTVSDMTEGTFEALCRTVQCFTSNETDWSAVKGKVTGNILKIECQDTSSTATISWMVVGERKDKHMVGLNWTDENGRVLVESLKNPVQTDFPTYPEHVNTSEDTNGTL